MELYTKISFTLLEWLALTGLVQCVWILVYVFLRIQNWRSTMLVVAYFLVLGISFLAQFSLRIEEYFDHIKLVQWLAWIVTPPLSYLLILQVARSSVPVLKEFLVLISVPMAVVAAFSLKDFGGVCDVKDPYCGDLFNWLYWISSIVGIVSILPIWAHKDIFSRLWKDRAGKEKYWLVMVLLIANVGIIAVNLLRCTDSIDPANADSILLVMGILFAYLATTTMFRVYPPPVVLHEVPSIIRHKKNLSVEEQIIAARIKELMEVDKLYHDAGFDRAALAREMQLSENVISRVINIAYDKSFPRLLNEYRVEDAKRMLQNSEIAVGVIASEVGFNSIATFNRIFKEVEGVPPSQYRKTIV